MPSPETPPTETCGEGVHVFRPPLTGLTVVCDCGTLSYQYDGRTFAPYVTYGVSYPHSNDALILDSPHESHD